MQPFSTNSVLNRLITPSSDTFLLESTPQSSEEARLSGISNRVFISDREYMFCSKWIRNIRGSSKGLFPTSPLYS